MMRYLYPFWVKKVISLPRNVAGVGRVPQLRLLEIPHRTARGHSRSLYDS